MPHEIVGVPSDHQFLVGLHHADRDWTLGTGNDRSVPRVAGGVQTNAEKPQVLADAPANCRHVFSDARREDQRVNTAQARRERLEIFFRFVAEEIDRLGRLRIFLRSAKTGQ